MFGDAQEFHTPKDKHYAHVGRGKHHVTGVPYWEMRNGVSFGNSYGYYGTDREGLEQEVQGSGQITGDNDDSAPVTAGGEGGESNSVGVSLGASTPGAM
jgi:hypothetical protein